MAKFEITFETDADVTAHDIHFLLTTQLNVYCGVREPLDKYVAERYATHPQRFRDDKIASLRKLTQLARDLNHSKEISSK